MIEACRTSPMLIELVRRVQDTRVFLQMTAIELRRIAEQAPDIAVELQHVARQLDAEAADWITAISNDRASVDTRSGR
jgi:hypothetical protein